MWLTLRCRIVHTRSKSVIFAGRMMMKWYSSQHVGTCRTWMEDRCSPVWAALCYLSLLLPLKCATTCLTCSSNTNDWLVLPDKTHIQSSTLAHICPASPPFSPLLHTHRHSVTHTLGLSLYRGVSNIQIYIDGCNLFHPSPSIKSGSPDIPMVQQLQRGHKLCDFQRKYLKKEHALLFDMLHSRAHAVWYYCSILPSEESSLHSKFGPSHAMWRNDLIIVMTAAVKMSRILLEVFIAQWRHFSIIYLYKCFRNLILYTF